MSDQITALLLTLAFFSLMAGWVPLLDLLQRLRRRRREAAISHDGDPPSVEAGDATSVA